MNANDRDMIRGKVRFTVAYLINGYDMTSPRLAPEAAFKAAQAELVGHLDGQLSIVKAMTFPEYQSLLKIQTTTEEQPK